MKRLIVMTLLTLIAAPAWAGVVMEIERTDKKHPAQTIEIRVEGRNLRINMKGGPEGSPGTVIFRGEKREMLAIDDGEKTYHLIDETSMKAVSGEVDTQMAEAMKEMEKALAEMPEEQRAMAEKMMKAQMGTMKSGPPPATSPGSAITKTGEKKTIGGYPCVKYTAKGEGKQMDIWLTDWDNIEGSDEIRSAFNDMSTFLKDIAGMFTQGGMMSPAANAGAFELFGEFQGFPVLAQEIGGGGTVMGETALRSVTPQKIDAKEFEAPKGYKKLAMGE